MAKPFIMLAKKQKHTRLSLDKRTWNSVSPKGTNCSVVGADVVSNKVAGGSDATKLATYTPSLCMIPEPRLSLSRTSAAPEHRE